MDVTDILKRLSEADGIAGFEEPVRNVIREAWQPLVDDLRVDGMGNLIGYKRGTAPEPAPKLMLAAHMDEIGLIVTGIEKGFIRITRVGGTDRRVLLGQEVVVHGERDLPGVVAARPPHVLPPAERTKTVAWDDLFVDVGLPAAEVGRLVQVGDQISFRAEVATLKNHRIAGKAFDDRACVTVVTLALEQIAQVAHVWDVIAVATVQEERGLKGAMTSAHGVAPDLAIALDVTFAAQPSTADVDTVPLGKGPSIGVGPNFHPILAKRLRDIGDAHEIPYHVEAIPGGSGTDAWAIQVSRAGVPTALISIPLRYMHQPVELLDTRDVERAARWLVAFIGELKADFLDSIALT
ncbi:MAG: M42 family metallopeptidase [Anaerolineales bacterium]|nr:M42 family metallopeptidase [Anaerolineales bacterium]